MCDEIVCFHSELACTFLSCFIVRVAHAIRVSHTIPATHVVPVVLENDKLLLKFFGRISLHQFLIIIFRWLLKC